MVYILARGLGTGYAAVGCVASYLERISPIGLAADVTFPPSVEWWGLWNAAEKGRGPFGCSFQGNGGTQRPSSIEQMGPPSFTVDWCCLGSNLSAVGRQMVMDK